MNLEQANGEILSVRGLRTYFFTKRGIVKAVDDISFDVRKGEILCIVGESGSGKTVTCLSIMRLIEPPGKIVGGDIILNGENLSGLSQEEMREIRGNRLAMIFQDPNSSLNPIFTIGEQIREAIAAHQSISKKEAQERIIQFLRLVGIPLPEERMHEYPHQFSGGMKQRAVIAMALACHPEMLIADEPTTALDLTIQAQILGIFLELRDKFNMSILYITHDLGIVSEIAQRIVVMYAGKILEKGTVDDIMNHPAHPYTKGLIACLLSEKGKLVSIPGSIPDIANTPTGCVFHPRCSCMKDICRITNPEMRNISDEHFVSCLLLGDD